MKKMILFTNLEDVKIENKNYKPMPILKLTTAKDFDIKKISNSEKETLNLLKNESDTNGFKILINEGFYNWW